MERAWFWLLIIRCLPRVCRLTNWGHLPSSLFTPWKWPGCEGRWESHTVQLKQAAAGPVANKLWIYVLGSALGAIAVTVMLLKALSEASESDCYNWIEATGFWIKTWVSCKQNWELDFCFHKDKHNFCVHALGTDQLCPLSSSASLKWTFYHPCSPCQLSWSSSA